MNSVLTQVPTATMYVVAFAFDDLGRVCLIEKQKPDWQKNRYNGVGGKVEKGETSRHAMVREFEEETGVKTVFADWVCAGMMQGPDWTVDVWTYHSPAIRDVKTMETEKVQLFTIPQVQHLHAIDNVPILVALCQLHQKTNAPKFILHYER